MVYWAHLIGSFLLRFVPPQVGYFLADLFAPLIGFCWPGHYRRARVQNAEVRDRKLRNVREHERDVVTALNTKVAQEICDAFRCALEIAICKATLIMNERNFIRKAAGRVFDNGREVQGHDGVFTGLIQNG